MGAVSLLELSRGTWLLLIHRRLFTELLCLFSQLLEGELLFLNTSLTNSLQELWLRTVHPLQFRARNWQVLLLLQ